MIYRVFKLVDRMNPGGDTWTGEVEALATVLVPRSDDQFADREVASTAARGRQMTYLQPPPNGVRLAGDNGLRQ